MISHLKKDSSISITNLNIWLECASLNNLILSLKKLHIKVNTKKCMDGNIFYYGKKKKNITL